MKAIELIKNKIEKKLQTETPTALEVANPHMSSCDTVYVSKRDKPSRPSTHSGRPGYLQTIPLPNTGEGIPHRKNFMLREGWPVSV